MTLRIFGIIVALVGVYLTYISAHQAPIVLACYGGGAILAILSMILLWHKPAIASPLAAIFVIAGVVAQMIVVPRAAPAPGEATAANPAAQATQNASAQPGASAPGSSTATVPSATALKVVEKVGKDPASLLSFVSGGVRGEIYPGVFRGAAATLEDRAGNDYDRALLLHDLLTAANPAQPVRFAFCSLDAQQADAVIAAARASYRAPLLVADVADKAQSQEKDPKLRDLFATVAAFWKAAIAQDHAETLALTSDFRTAGAQVPAPSPRDLRSIASDHVWVQTQSNGAWTDLDPTVPDAKPGASRCNVERTADTIPDSSYVTVELSVKLETRNGTDIEDRTIQSGKWTASQLADTPLTFAFAESAGLQSPSPAPSGMYSFTPVLRVGTQVAESPAIVVPAPVQGVSPTESGKSAKSAGASALQAFGSAPPVAPTPVATPSGPIPIALWLDAVVKAPESPEVAVERPIFDRIAVADRDAGHAATAKLHDAVFASFGTVWNVAINLGTGVVGVGDSSSVERRTNDPGALIHDLGLAQRGYYTVRRSVFADERGPNAAPIEAARPGISFLGTAPVASGPYAGELGLVMDRASDSAIPDGATPADAI
ncbi:MAG TPA: hypothetical protein VGZ02_00095, partial [Candidatus Baltobacteraceae bacterium]|nr:hypothetical protein [Candidatus Baltobacteraceae bacterium]